MVSVTPVTVTVLANDISAIPARLWLLVLKVAPPAEKVPVLVIPFWKTIFPVVVTVVEVQLPEFSTEPTKVLTPVLLLKVSVPAIL